MKRTVILLGLLAATFTHASESLHANLFHHSPSPIAEISLPSIQPQPVVSKPATSVGKAFIKSLILPGWGQRSVGAKTKSELFFGAEVGLWLTYVGFTTYGKWREQDYRTYAATQAGVDLDGKSSSYFIDVGNFRSIYDYNAYRLQQRNTLDYYFDVEAYFWQWQNEAHRKKFDQLRISSDTARNRATFTLGAIVANHILSAIDAVWSARRQDAQHAQTTFDVHFGDGVMQPLVHFSLAKHF